MSSWSWAPQSCLTFCFYLYEKPLVCSVVLVQGHSSQCELHGGSSQQHRVGVELPHFTLDARLLGLKYELNPLGVTWTDHTWMRRGSEDVTQGRRAAVKIRWAEGGRQHLKRGESQASRCLVVLVCTRGRVEVEVLTLCPRSLYRKAACHGKLLPAVEDGRAALIVQLQVRRGSFTSRGLKY